MKIASAPALLTSVTAREAAARSIVAGDYVAVEGSSGSAGAQKSILYTQEANRQIAAGFKKVATVQVDDSFLKQLNLPGITVGAVTGTLAGAAIGTMLNLLKTVHPTSAVAFDATCAVLGCASGAAVGSGMFKLDLKMEGDKPVVGIAPVLAK
jgi:Rieske Fe-S protein